MAYNQFTLQRASADFGLVVETVPTLFPDVPPVPLPEHYRVRERTYWPLATTESGRSQYLIAPLLGEVWVAGDLRIALFSGPRFDVDEAAGLTGVCDFIIGLPPQLELISAPVVMIAEAKKEDIYAGLGQCAAELVAARRFNSARGGPGDPLHGLVTDGDRWRFLRLTGDTLTVETPPRLISDIDLIYGILLHVCGIHPAQAAP